MIIPYEYEPHIAVKVKGISWAVCKRCGLIYLKNDFTNWALKKGCNADDHPEYENARMRFTGQKG